MEWVALGLVVLSLFTAYTCGWYMGRVRAMRDCRRIMEVHQAWFREEILYQSRRDPETDWRCV